MFFEGLYTFSSGSCRFCLPKTIKTTKKLLENPNNQLKLMKTEEALKEEKIPKGYEVKKIEDLDSKDKYKRRILVTIGLQKDA